MKALLLASALAAVFGAAGFLIAGQQPIPPAPTPAVTAPADPSPPPESAPAEVAANRPVADPMAAARSTAPAAVYDPMAAARGVSAPAASVYDPLAALRAPAPAAPAATDTDETFQGLPVSAGVEDTFYSCSGCHSMELVTQQRLTRQRWDRLLDWMVAEQGMPPLDDAQRDLILSYLDRHFSP